VRRHPDAQRFPRALTLAERPPAAREIPILGRIAAGLPLQSEENREGPLPLAADWFGARPDELFSLRVRGESLVNAHSVDGDVVVVRRQGPAGPPGRLRRGTREWDSKDADALVESLLRRTR
jgi:repressor LexA